MWRYECGCSSEPMGELMISPAIGEKGGEEGRGRGGRGGCFKCENAYEVDHE